MTIPPAPSLSLPLDEFGRLDIGRLKAEHLLFTRCDVFIHSRHGGVSADLTIHAGVDPSCITLLSTRRAYEDPYAVLAARVKELSGKQVIVASVIPTVLWNIARELAPHVPPHLISRGFWEGHAIG